MVFNAPCASNSVHQEGTPIDSTPLKSDDRDQLKFLLLSIVNVNVNVVANDDNTPTKKPLESTSTTDPTSVLRASVPSLVDSSATASGSTKLYQCLLSRGTRLSLSP